MFLTKYDPSRQLDSVWRTFDNDLFPMFRSMFLDQDEDECRLPRTNINEKEKEYVVTMEMPGISKSDVEVSIDDNTLTIEANRTEKLESEGLLRREIKTNKFQRSFTLGAKIDRDNAKAKMENGILKLTLPKSAEKVGRKIDIS